MIKSTQYDLLQMNSFVVCDVDDDDLEHSNYSSVLDNSKKLLRKEGNLANNFITI